MNPIIIVGDKSPPIMALSSSNKAPIATVVVAQDGSGHFQGTTEECIQEAIDSITAGWIHIKQGTYNISNAITMKSNIWITGTIGTVLKLTTGANCNILNYNSATSIRGIKIENIKFDGSGSNQSSTSHCIYLRICSESVISDCWFEEPRDYGVKIGYDNPSMIGTTYNRITRNYFHGKLNDSSTAIHSEGQGDVICNNVIDTHNTGIKMLGCLNSNISNNYFNGCSWSGSIGLDVEDTTYTNFGILTFNGCDKAISETSTSDYNNYGLITTRNSPFSEYDDLVGIHNSVWGII